MTLGPPLVYVPVCNSAPHRQQGPLGYALVDKVLECPICVEAKPSMKRINVELNLTLRCNAACTNCNRLCHMFPDRGPEEDMSVGQVMRFVEQVAASPVQVKRLKLLGGEPLLHPEFDRIYNVLGAATIEGFIQSVKIETNGTLPRPDVPHYDRVHWAGRSFKRKRHLPTCWSPQDLGLPSPNAPCSMPRICGISLDAYGYSLCSMCPMMYRVFKSEHFYVDEFPWDWSAVFSETIDRLCPHCIFSAAKDFKNLHCYQISDTPSEGKDATTTWRYYLDQFDGYAKKERW